MNFKRIFFIFPFLYVVLKGQQCYPNFLIDQFLQDSVTIDFSQDLSIGNISSSTSLIKTYNHTYWTEYFTFRPQIAYCISEFQFQFDKNISYLLTAAVNSGSILFTLNSLNVKWSLVTINIWLFNRQDMQSILIAGGKKYQYQENIAKKQKYTINTTISFSFFSNLKTTNKTLQFASFLIGLNSKTTNNYHDVQVKSQSIQNGNLNNLNYCAEVSSQNSNIISQVNLVIFMFYSTFTTERSNPFIYDLNSYSLGQFPKTFRILNTKFQPVINKLVGIKSFVLQTGIFYNISQTFDMFTSLLTVTSFNSTFQNLEFIQIILSVPMNSMCSCNNTFVKIDGCFSSCYSKEDFHQFVYLGSNSKIIGKTCLKCPQQVGLVYSQAAKMCICSDGLKMVNGICSPVSSQLSSKDIINCPDPNSYLSLNGECLCKPTYNLMKNNTCMQCSFITIFNNATGECQTPIKMYGCVYQNQTPNSDQTQCVCKTGFEKFDISCVPICSTNSKRNSTSGICICSNGFQLINQSCYVICGTNMIRNYTDFKCYCNIGYMPLSTNSSFCVLIIPICNRLNEISINNLCLCASGYYNISGNCSQCSGGRIFNQSKSSCICQQNYQFDGQNCVPLPIQIIPTKIVNEINSSIENKESTLLSQSNQLSNSINVKKVTNSQSGANSNLNVSSSQNNSLPNIKISLASNIFTSPGIITDFTITPSVKRSQSQVQNLFTGISFSSSQFQPPQIFLSQNKDDLASYRCYLYYQNNLPYRPFSVTYNVKDSQSQSHITLLYDGMKASISNALKSQGSQSFLT